MIAAAGVTIRAGGRDLLRAVSLSVTPGEVVALVGPNGAGKSTLLRALAGELRPREGRIRCEGIPVGDWDPLLLARRRAVVSQHAALAFPMRAAEVVALGRLPWHATPQAAQDEAAIAAALAEAGVAPLAQQAYATLSGGERQRVQVARALAQLHGAPRPAALLLDEPTASLDVRHGAAVLALLRRLARSGLAVLVVLHDLNEAAFVADRVAVLAGGALVTTGTAAEALRPGLLEDVYGIAFRDLDGALVPDFPAALSRAAPGVPP
jgi:iron complex transport system ATP-binding protein